MSNEQFFLPYKDILTLRAKNSIYEHTKFKIYSELEVKYFRNVKVFIVIKIGIKL